MDEIKKTKNLTVIFGATVKGAEPPKTDPNALDWRDPVIRMFKFMQDAGYRVIDLMKRLDKDRSLSVDREEFKQGLMVSSDTDTVHIIKEAFCLILHKIICCWCSLNTKLC